ncbi:hypothetical protein [Pseudomonas silesiensis]|uniref:hypothetical protein n=1 Tax=Pseudomonas silesiensis TaxID=1853130 RepID=UPI000A7B44B5|nr:hypothetical protein [Pseudomonas silesiensis]
MKPFDHSPQPTGSLTVTIASRLNRGGRKTEISIRDHSLALLSCNTLREFDLKPGIYEVSALNDAGEKSEHIVRIHPNKTTSLKLNFKLAESIDSHLKDEDFRTLQNNEIISLKSTQFSLHGASAGLEINELENQMIVRHTGEMLEVSTITVLCNDEFHRFSLPLSNGTHHRSVFCHLLADTLKDFGIPRVRLSQGRTVASAMERLYESNRLRNAAEIAKDSLKYLTSQVEDPTGILIGALALFKADRLKDDVEWLESFNDKYPWLPDGKILLACLMSDEYPDSSMKLALAASEQTILYRDTFSMLINFLRQWPDKESLQRNTALEYLGRISPYINWRSTYLCLSLPQKSSGNNADV